MLEAGPAVDSVSWCQCRTSVVSNSFDLVYEEFGELVSSDVSWHWCAALLAWYDCSEREPKFLRVFSDAIRSVPTLLLFTEGVHRADLTPIDHPLSTFQHSWSVSGCTAFTVEPWTRVTVSSSNGTRRSMLVDNLSQCIIISDQTRSTDIFVNIQPFGCNLKWRLYNAPCFGG